MHYFFRSPPIRALALAVLLLISAGPACGFAAEPNGNLSSAAERLYASARPRLLQIRTLLAAAGRQTSIGSGFLVSGDGLAITNYHVVSQVALDPDTYRLQYVAPDGSRGHATLLAVDLPNDLAVVRLDRKGGDFFTFDDDAVAGRLAQGERLYAMGNPLDLGFTIVEGTYNGLVERAYNERIHFSGALNPGMSGGPAVRTDGRVAGINVARLLGGELVSFLVPARFAVALIERARGGAEPKPYAFRKDVWQQLRQWQTGLYAAFAQKGFRTALLGPYGAPESAAPWFTCWAATNENQLPKPRADISRVNCNSDTRLFIATDLSTGTIHIAHSHIRGIDLNRFQFATFVSQHSRSPGLGALARKWWTAQRCHVDFVVASGGAAHPPLRALWCARAYRDVADLYDVSITTVTQDRGTEALVSQLSLQAVSYPQAVTLARRFIEGVQWAK